MTFKNQHQQLFYFKLVFQLFHVEPVSLQKRYRNFDLFYLTRTAKFRSQLYIPTFSYIRPNYNNIKGTKRFKPKHVAFILPEYNVVLTDFNIYFYLITQRVCATIK